MAKAQFSKVMTFDECSDAPNWSRLGIFSCHNFDKWRERLRIVVLYLQSITNVTKIKQGRSFMFKLSAGI